MTKKMKADAISLKEKRLLFDDKTKMILEDICTQNEARQRDIDQRYAGIQEKLKQNFEEKNRLDTEKETQVKGEKVQMEDLNKKELEINQEISRLEKLLTQAREGLLDLTAEKARVERELKEKETKFVEKELRLENEFTLLTKQKEAEEALKMTEDKTQQRITVEKDKLTRNFDVLDDLIAKTETRVSSNWQFFDKLLLLFDDSKQPKSTNQEDVQSDIFMNKRSFEKKMNSLTFELESVRDDIATNEKDIQTKTGEIDSLQIQINTNDNNKKVYIKEKKFSQANTCMKMSKKFNLEKQNKQEEIDRLKQQLQEQKANANLLKQDLDQMREGASEMWLNLKKHALLRVQRGQEVFEVFCSVFDSKIFEHLKDSEKNKKSPIHLESEKDYLESLKTQLQEKADQLKSEIREQDETEFDGQSFQKVRDTLNEFESKLNEMDQVQSTIGKILTLK